MILAKTAEQFRRHMECCKKAGIYHTCMLAFGGLLGFCRDKGGVNMNDDDLDVMFHSELITAEQEEKYLIELEKAGLFQYRKRVQRLPNGRLFWCSLRAFPEKESWKCCNWFMWTYKGYTWHCKGVGAAIKGIPSRFLEIGPEVDYMGTKVHVPKLSGSAIDHWYPDWLTPRGGNSSKRIILRVGKWNDKSTWVVDNE